MRRKIIGKLIELKKNRKSGVNILLLGAKQVGKTYAAKEFAALCYENLVYVDFEKNAEVRELFYENKSIKTIIKRLENFYSTIIIPEKTLIFLDEINAHENGMEILKKFQSEGAAYNVIGACTSLPGNSVEQIASEKAEYMEEKEALQWEKVLKTTNVYTVYPLDFEEFLWANGKDEMVDLIKNHYETMTPMPQKSHRAALNLYNNYLITGGMPTVVCAHLYHKNPYKEQEYKGLIIDSYISHMTNMLSNSKSIKAKEAYLSIPGQLCRENRKFRYKCIKEGGRASFYADTIELLKNMGVVLQCKKQEEESNFKLYMNDPGLLAAKLASFDNITMQRGDKNSIFGLTENYVACALRANGHELKYWSSSGIAEVDFIIEKNKKIIPIELNLEESTKTKSLRVYRENFHPSYCIQISAGNFAVNQDIYNIPLYGVFNL